LTTHLSGADLDNSPSQILFRVTSATQYGQLRLNGSTTLGVGSVFTQQDLEGSKVSYQHDGLEGTADNFKFALSDGGGSEVAGTFSIAVLAVNDTPVITLPAARTAVQSTALAITGISINDP
ncbi:hypothetical protein JZU54_01740, partial [bacterium]|nr:hypothetical protein [bacterium]